MTNDEGTLDLIVAPVEAAAATSFAGLPARDFFDADIGYPFVPTHGGMKSRFGSELTRIS